MISLQTVYISSVIVFGLFLNYTLYVDKRRPISSPGLDRWVDFMVLIIGYIFAPLTVVASIIGIGLQLLARRFQK